MKYQLVLSTVPNKKTARRIADQLLDEKLAACVSITSEAESRYVWKGKREVAKEYLLLIKTRASLFSKLSKKLQKIHPYDVPEIIALPIDKGNAPYLKWLSAETKS